MNIKLIFLDPDLTDETGNLNIIECPNCAFRYVDPKLDTGEGHAIAYCKICKKFFNKRERNIPFETVREMLPYDERLDDLY